MKFTKWKSILSQAALMGLQVLATQSSTLSGWNRAAAQIGIATAQSALVAATSNRNPDGTPASTPYNPPEKE